MLSRRMHERAEFLQDNFRRLAECLLQAVPALQGDSQGISHQRNLAG